MFECKCGKSFEKKDSLSAHKGHCKVYLGEERHAEIESAREGKKPWNFGLTSNTDERVKRNSESISQSLKGKWVLRNLPQSEVDKINAKISESLKKAHSEGRAHNIGECRWKNEPSYPERFFISVIENEFYDKNYVRELYTGKYSIDFAWEAKMLAIEIEGDQHLTDESIAHDSEKDRFLTSNGWRVLRVRWKDMYDDPRRYIDLCKEFVGS
jgi:very-short-patch-repair endonuclease